MPGQRRELRASTLGRRLIVTVQYDGIPVLAAFTQPGSGDGVVGESVFVFEPGCHEEGKPHSPCIHLVCESRSEITCLVSDSGH